MEDTFAQMKNPTDIRDSQIVKNIKVRKYFLAYAISGKIFEEYLFCRKSCMLNSVKNSSLRI